METIQNSVQLIGRAGKDVEAHSTSTDRKYVRFSLATNDFYKDANGEKQADTQWHNIVAWGKTAENIAEHIKKGSQLIIKGKLQSRNYEGSNGEKKSITEVLVREFMLL